MFVEGQLSRDGQVCVCVCVCVCWRSDDLGVARTHTLPAFFPVNASQGELLCTAIFLSSFWLPHLSPPLLLFDP
jgi:hypothetical protein